MGKYVMALDAGTTSNRCILFNEKGAMVSVAQKEFTQYFPKPGWVEHDPEEIYANTVAVVKNLVEKAGIDKFRKQRERKRLIINRKGKKVTIPIRRKRRRQTAKNVPISFIKPQK